MPEWLNGAVSKTVVGLVPTVGSNPTLSAGQIAQHQLGDLTFKVEYRHFTYSSALVNQHLTDRPWTGGFTSWRG